jgi:hypothetical protein
MTTEECFIRQLRIFWKRNEMKGSLALKALHGQTNGNDRTGNIPLIMFLDPMLYNVGANAVRDSITPGPYTSLRTGRQSGILAYHIPIAPPYDR